MGHDRKLFVRFIRVSEPEGAEIGEMDVPLYPGETILDTFRKGEYLGLLIVHTERRYSHDTSRQRSRV